MLLTRFVAGMFSAGLMFLSAGAVFGQTSSTGSGQAYPNKPIRLVTAAVGGGGDIVARAIAQGISGPLGQPVVVDNRGGGVIPGEIVSKAPPDGYTLLVQAGILWITPLLIKTSYDPVKDFLPITLVISQPNVLVVHPSLPVDSVKALIAMAKAKPGALNASTGGNGGSTHMALELFKSLAGVNIVRVPYSSGSQEIADLLGSRIQLTFGAGAEMAPHIKSGKLKALAVTTAQPSLLFPELPTIAATVPGYQASGVIAMFAPANTPGAVINRLNREAVQYVSSADVKEKFLNSGSDVVGSSPEQLAARMQADIAGAGKVIKDAGIKAN